MKIVEFYVSFQTHIKYHHHESHVVPLYKLASIFKSRRNDTTGLPTLYDTDH